MSESFNLYPVLTEDQVSAAISSPTSLTFFYYSNGEEVDLHLENKSDNGVSFSAELQDPKCDWYPETHDLMMQRVLLVNDPTLWFGKDGVVSQNATIGIAQQWVSLKSETRGVIPMGEIKYGDKNVECVANYTFPKSTIKGSLFLKTIVYLKDPGRVNDENGYLCTQTGTVLGEIDSCEIFVDGNGSVFPIATINDPSQPLWLLYFDDTADPMQDAFDHEHVEIRLNRAHPCYDQLKIEGSLKESPLFLEVISAALMIIIESTRMLLGPDWDIVISGQENFVHGSIAEAINYFVVKLGWDTSSPSKLARSIHNFFDDKLQGGVL